jgi:TRAP-type uncharacterized transport system fused permease subunit
LGFGSTGGVVALVAASEGYLLMPLPMPWRALFGVAGALLITTQALPALIGFLLLLFGGLWLWGERKGVIRWRSRG